MLQTTMTEESPLDVLSRAATMVSPPPYDEARTHTNKELPTTKWRKERRQINRSLETPLDFSTKNCSILKPPPPSYDQSIQNKKHSRPSVIQCNTQITNKNEKQSLDDISDPAIDEHFRRSLGKEYSSIFRHDTKEVKCQDLNVDSPGLSVDDHFAKALGETWLKLQAKENQEKVTSSTNNNSKSNHKTTVVGKNAKKGKDSVGNCVLRDKRRIVATST